MLVAMYFRMSWSEPRVEGVVEGAGTATTIPLSSEVAREAWLPDIYIHEARDVATFKMIQNVEGVYLSEPNTFLFSVL